MAEYLTNTAELTSIANAIRTRSETTATLSFSGGFVSAINAIPTDTIYIGVDSSNTNVNRYFRNNSYITYIDLPFITEATATYAFENCTELIEARLPNITTATNYMFSGCTKLKTVYLNSCTRIMPYVFKNATVLESVYMLSPTVATADSNAFNGLGSSAKFYVPSSLLSSYKAASNWSTIASQIYASP